MGQVSTANSPAKRLIAMPHHVQLLRIEFLLSALSLFVMSLTDRLKIRELYVPLQSLCGGIELRFFPRKWIAKEFWLKTRMRSMRHTSSATRKSEVVTESSFYWSNFCFTKVFCVLFPIPDLLHID